MLENAAMKNEMFNNVRLPITIFGYCSGKSLILQIKNVLNVYDFTVICCKSGRLFGIYAKNMVNFFYFVI